MNQDIIDTITRYRDVEIETTDKYHEPSIEWAKTYDAGYGTTLVLLTRKDVEALLAGKALHAMIRGEYGALIALKSTD